ncbi:MAG: hypothetical protein ACREQJ_08200 [Candidatus Binatia bacterium]
MLIELGMLGYFSFQEGRAVTDFVPPNPLLTEQSCAGERYRTSQAIFVYAGEHGAPPETLDALVGTHLLSRPVDPATKLPLKYQKFPNGFRLECAKLPE